ITIPSSTQHKTRYPKLPEVNHSYTPSAHGILFYPRSGYPYLLLHALPGCGNRLLGKYLVEGEASRSTGGGLMSVTCGGLKIRGGRTRIWRVVTGWIRLWCC
ncbi:unnamed protein product, partial [Tuber aestivum]